MRCQYRIRYRNRTTARCLQERPLVNALGMVRGRARAVEDAVHRVGGLIDASHAARVTTTSVYRWLKAGHIRDARPLLLLAERAEPADLKVRWALARKLAGLD